MKPKQLFIGLIVVLCVGAGIYALLNRHAEADANTEEGTTPSEVSIQTGTLKRMTLHRGVNAYATVEPAPATPTEPAADAPLAAPAAGVIAKVNVVEGQHVEKGDVLVELNSGAATAEYAAQQLERQKQLYADHNTSLKALQDAQVQLDMLRIVTPLSGTVARLNVKPGAAVDVSTVVVEVMDLNRLVATAGIPAAEAGDLKPGQEVLVQTEPPVAATLSFVSPTVDPANGTVMTRALLPANSGLRPGQFVSLRIVTAVHANCLAAPVESAVTDDGGHTVVALVKGDQATRTPVQTGLREGGWVEITGADLKEGDAVATVGAYALPEKTKVIVANPSGVETAPTNSQPSQPQ